MSKYQYCGYFLIFQIRVLLLMKHTLFMCPIFVINQMTKILIIKQDS